MAYVIFNDKHSLSFIAKNIDHLSFRFPKYELYQNKKAGSMHEISDADFISLQTGVKKIKFDGSNITYEDCIILPYADKASLKLHQDKLLEVMNFFKNGCFNKSNSLYLEIQDYINTLNNLDLDSIPLPLSIPLNKYLKDQNINIVSPLQL